MNTIRNFLNKFKLDTSKQPALSFVFSASFFVVGAVLISVVFWQGMTRPQSSTTTQVPLLVQATAQIKPDQDIIVTLPGGDITVYMPANFALQGGYFQMVSREANLFPDNPPTDWTRPRIINLEVVALDGMVSAVTMIEPSFRLCYALTNSDWDRFIEFPGDFSIDYYNPGNSAWEAITINPYADFHMLCADSGRLGLYALSMKAVPLPISGGTQAPYTP